jgi:hypothetical protein
MARLTVSGRAHDVDVDPDTPLRCGTYQRIRTAIHAAAARRVTGARLP